MKLVINSVLHHDVVPTSDKELIAALDEVAELARRENIGQAVELRVNVDVVMVAYIDVPESGFGWALGYDNSLSGQSLYSVVGGVDPEEIVEIKWGDSWEEVERRCFIEPQLAQAALIGFLRDGSLLPAVTWA